MLKFPLLASVAVLLVAPAVARAADLGSPAPALAISEWVKGKPVTLAEGRGRTVYVVEFWATWCPPCRQSIPHLTAMQKRFQDSNVVFVGISDEPVGTVKPFVDRMGDEMGYRVALDRDGKTAAGYMEAFGVGGIPHAFVIDKAGNIVWHGHPLGGLDRVLERVLAGTHSADSARRAAAATTLMNEYFMGATAGQDAPELTAVADRILTEARDLPDLLHQFAHVVLNEKRIVVRQPEVALRAAEAAHRAGAKQDARIAQTYAQALALNRRTNDAVKVLQTALRADMEDRVRAGLQAELARLTPKGK